MEHCGRAPSAGSRERRRNQRRAPRRRCRDFTVRVEVSLERHDTELASKWQCNSARRCHPDAQHRGGPTIADLVTTMLGPSVTTWDRSRSPERNAAGTFREAGAVLGSSRHHVSSEMSWCHQGRTWSKPTPRVSMVTATPTAINIGEPTATPGREFRFGGSSHSASGRVGRRNTRVPGSIYDDGWVIHTRVTVIRVSHRQLAVVPGTELRCRQHHQPDTNAGFSAITWARQGIKTEAMSDRRHADRRCRRAAVPLKLPSPTHDWSWDSGLIKVRASRCRRSATTHRR